MYCICIFIHLELCTKDWLRLRAWHHSCPQYHSKCHRRWSRSWCSTRHWSSECRRGSHPGHSCRSRCPSGTGRPPTHYHATLAAKWRETWPRVWSDLPCQGSLSSSYIGHNRPPCLGLQFEVSCSALSSVVIMSTNWVCAVTTVLPNSPDTMGTEPMSCSSQGKHQ